MSLKKYLRSQLDEFSFKRKEAKFIEQLQQIDNNAVLNVNIEGDEVNFSHNGHLGDIIYSLPAAFTLAQGKKINYYLRLNLPFSFSTKKLQHPNGNILLTEQNLRLISPLLLHQPEINSCDTYSGQHIHYDLGSFRNYPFDFRMGSISRWYFMIYGINADLGKAWLTADPDTSVNNAIVLGRSSRYRAPGINYSFLKKYPRIVFVGLPAEYDEMKLSIPNLEYRTVKDYLELATIIAGCKFFIGNQSFPFSIAEALKVKRVLEVFYQAPNVIVEGADGYDFCIQPQFEKIVSSLYGNS
jgi:hypothetical protein